MMMPSIPSNSSYSGGASSSSAVNRVEKATSEFLNGPDWTMNIDICDMINSNQGLAKDVVKAVKRRVQHKNPKVQLLSLTLLETMVKNCGDYVHFQIADRNILQEMVKIVKKKTDMRVRDKILVLLDSWQEAFGGPGGKYSQYYWAYEDLRRSGVEFPQRSLDTAPIFTPPVTHPMPRTPQPGYGMPSNSSTRLDEAMAAETESLSLSSISSMRDVLDLLADMLQAVDPGDRSALKDEVIVDLVDRCRTNQKKLMEMLATTVDEELLGQGLDLNDGLQSVLARHDAIASGSPLPITNVRVQSSETRDSSVKPAGSSTATANGNPSALVQSVVGSRIDEEEEEEDDFAQLARRHTKGRPSSSQASSQSGDGGNTPPNSSVNKTAPQEVSPSPSNALVPVDPPTPVKTTKEQDIIDLLSITLSTTSMSPPETPAQPPPATEEPQHQGPSPSPPQGNNNPYASQAYPGIQGPTFNSYVVPWAQPQPQQPVPNHSVQQQPQYHPQYYGQPQPQVQQQQQPQVPQYSNAYPPPPWAATPGYYASRPAYGYSTPQGASNALVSSQGIGTLQQQGNATTSRGNNTSALNGNATVSSGNGNVATPPPGQKQFVPSYRLFEDLNVLPNSSPSLNGSMVRGK